MNKTDPLKSVSIARCGMAHAGNIGGAARAQLKQKAGNILRGVLKALARPKPRRSRKS